MNDLYGMPGIGLSTDAAVENLPNYSGNIPSVQDYLDEQRMYHGTQFLTPTGRPTPPVPAPAPPPAAKPKILTWPEYKAASGADPATAYDTYVSQVLPSEIDKLGYGPAQKAKVIKEFTDIVPPPPKPVVPVSKDEGLIGNALTSLKQGFKSGTRAGSLSVAAVTGDKKALADILSEAAPTPAGPLSEFQQQLGTIDQSSYWSTIKGVVQSAIVQPQGAIDFQLFQLAQSYPSLLGAIIGGTAGLPLGRGAIATGALGVGVGSGAIEFGSQLEENIQAALKKEGIDTKDKAAVVKFLEDSTKYNSVVVPAIKKAVVVAAADALTAGISGGAGYAVTKTTSPLKRGALAAGGLAIEPVGGAAGEYLSQKAAGMPENKLDVVLEFAGELPGGAAHVAGGAAVGLKNRLVQPTTPSAATPPGVVPPPPPGAVPPGAVPPGAVPPAVDTSDAALTEEIAKGIPAIAPTTATTAPPLTTEQFAGVQDFNTLGTTQGEVTPPANRAPGIPAVERGVAAQIPDAEILSTPEVLTAENEDDALVAMVATQLAREVFNEQTQEDIAPDNIAATAAPTVATEPTSVAPTIPSIPTLGELVTAVPGSTLKRGRKPASPTTDQQGVTGPTKTESTGTSDLGRFAEKLKQGRGSRKRGLKAVVGGTNAPTIIEPDVSTGVTEGTGQLTVERWYDRKYRSWVAQLKDKNGNQVGEAIHAATKDEIDKITESDFNVVEPFNALTDLSKLRGGAVAPGSLTTGLGKKVGTGKNKLLRNKGVAVKGKPKGGLLREKGSALSKREADILAQIPDEDFGPDASIDNLLSMMQSLHYGDEYLEALKNGDYDTVIEIINKAGDFTKPQYELYQAINAGFAKDALEIIAAHAERPVHKLVAKLLLAANVFPRVQFFNHNDPTVFGTHYSSTDSAAIDAGVFFQQHTIKGVGDFESLVHTFLHEVVHAATTTRMTKAFRLMQFQKVVTGYVMQNPDFATYSVYDKDGTERVGKKYDTLQEAEDTIDYARRELRANFGYMNGPSFKAARRIFDTFDYIKKQGGETFKSHYGSTNPLELVTEALTNPKFQEYLSKITLPRQITNQPFITNAWSWFIKEMKNLLGITNDPNNAIGQIIRDITDVMRERQPLMMFRFNNAILGTPEEAEGHKALREKYGGGVARYEASKQEPVKETIQLEPDVDKVRSSKMMGRQIYDESGGMAALSIKELLQNSYDAIKPLIQRTLGKLKDPKIQVITDKNTRQITVIDNGTGMDPQTLATTFLKVAGTKKEGERSSGGFGVAKLQFIYDSPSVQIVTLNNGVLTEASTSGAQLYEGMEDTSKRPYAEITRGVKTTKDFPEGHGTKITVTIPESWEDQTTNEIKPIKFPESSDEIDALNKSPLFEDISVTFNGQEVQNIGKTFQKDKYTQYLDINFGDGNIKGNVYITKDEVKYPSRGNVHVLSNGIWQFDLSILKNPNNSWSDPIPFDIYINVESKIKPHQVGYPFALNRQSFSPATKAGFDALITYIGAQHRVEDIATGVKSFGNLTYVTINKNGKYEAREGETLTPKKPPRPNALNSIKKGDSVEIKDGKLFVKGRQIPELTKKELEGQTIDYDEFTVDENKVPKDEAIIHNNWVAPLYDTPEIKKLKAEYDIAVKNWYNNTGDTSPEDTGYDKYVRAREAFHKALGGKKVELKPITEIVEKQFGTRFYEFAYELTDWFASLRNVASEYLKLPELINEAVGISFDKYRGVSIRVPFRGMFVNPALAKGMENPRFVGQELFYTMIHEIAHHQYRDHDTSFMDEMNRILYTIEEEDPQALIDIKNGIIDLVIKNFDIIKFLNEVHTDESGQPIGKRFTDSKQSTGSDVSSQDVGGVSNGGAAFQRVSKPATGSTKGSSNIEQRARSDSKAQSDALNEMEHTPVGAILGHNKETGERTHIAYPRKDGNYDLYEVTDPTTDEGLRGDKDTKLRSVPESVVMERLQAEDADVLRNTREDFGGPPKNTATQITKWKDGTWRFAAYKQPDGKWNIYEGEDLHNRALPRSKTVVNLVDDVEGAFAGKDYSNTQKQSDARQRQNETRDMTKVEYTPPSKANINFTDLNSPVKYLGYQVAKALTAANNALPEALRIDFLNILKNSHAQTQIDNTIERETKPLMRKGQALMKDTGWNEERLSDLHAALVIAERNPKIFAKYTPDIAAKYGKKNKDAEATALAKLSALTPDQRAKLEAYAREWKIFTNKTVDINQAAGFLSSKAATNIKNAYQFYAPLGDKNNTTGRKTATGQSETATDIYAKMQKQRYDSIVSAVDNNAKQALLKVLEDYTSNIVHAETGEKLFDIGPILKLKRDPQTGRIDEFLDPLTMNRNSIIVYRDGQPIRINVNDKDMVKALDQFPNRDRNTMLQRAAAASAMFNYMYGSTKTLLSPVFAARNFSRDMATAFAQLDPAIPYNTFVKNIFSPQVWSAAIREGLASTIPSLMEGNAPGAKLAREATEAGALISRKHMLGLDQLNHDVATGLDPGLWAKTKEFAHFEGPLFGFLSAITKSLENVTRMSIYKAGKDTRTAEHPNGLSNTRAAIAAKTGTVNFEPKGAASGVINPLYVFANAKLQGIRTLGQNLGFAKGVQEANTRTQVAAGVAVLAGLLAGYMLWSNSDKDKDGKKRAGKIPDYKRDGFMIVDEHLPGLPVPQELGAFYVLGNSLADYFFGDKEDKGLTATARFGTNMIQNFWPAGSAQYDPIGAKSTPADYVTRMMLPTPFLLLYDIGTNKTTFGEEIVRNKDRLTKLGVPSELMGNKNSTGFAKFMANQTVGAPQQWDYLAKQMVGPQIDVMKWITGQEPDYKDQRMNPFMKTFMPDVSPYADKNTYETVHQKIEEAHTRWKRADLPDKPRVYEKYKTELQLYPALHAYDNQISALLKNIGKLSPERKAEVEERITDIRSKALKKYYEVTGSR